MATDDHCVLRGMSLSEAMGFLREIREGFTEVTSEEGQVRRKGL